MKKPLNTLTIVVILTTLLLLINSCGNDDEPEVKQGDVEFRFNYTVNGQPLDLGQIYNVNGTAVSFKFANFYIGNIVFNPQQGAEVSLNDKFLLVTPDLTTSSVGKIDEGSYSVRFSLGVNDAENDQSETDFLSRATDDPLAMKNPSMHWGWNGGYKYIRVDGLSDTDGDGTPETPLAFHLGNFDMFEFISNFDYNLNSDIKEGNNIIEFEFDLAKLFIEIDISTQTDTHVFNDVDLAKIYQGNLSKAIDLL
ncbi:MAG: MbnP family protein [Saprospiraceae bacterium]